MGRGLIKNPNRAQSIVTLTDPGKLELYSEIIELYYSGDPIGYKKLADQFGLGRGMVQHILKKYKPRQGDKHIVVLLQSKINDMEGEGDYRLKQEKPTEDEL